MRKCRICQEEKEQIEYYGKQTECKKCHCIQKREYHKKNREIILAKKKIYTKKHKNERDLYNKKYFSRTEIKKRLKIYRKEYYQKNKNKISEHTKKPEIRKKINKREKDRRRKDPNFKIAKNMRVRIWNALKGKANKTAHTIELLGLPIQEFKKYIESLWLSNMSWDNYGYGNDKWHIDHIIPCDSFDLSKEEEQRKCFHYSNLQPLWQSDNFKKSDKVLLNDGQK